MQAQEIMGTRPEATTEQERQFAEGFARLGSAEKVFFNEILKGIAGGDNMENTLIHQPHEYMAILKNVDVGHLLDALPLMRYIKAKWHDGGDMTITLGMAYAAGIADGKRLDRARRAQWKA